MARPEFRFVPLLGALSVVLVVVGFLLIGDTPDHHALGPEIRDDYDNETKHQTAAFLVALGAVPLLFFAGYLRAVLTRLHPGRLSANVALAGAVVAATGLAVLSLIHAALAEAAQTPEFSDEALQSLNALDGWSFYPLAMGLSTFVLASGVALVRDRRFFAPFLGWAAVVLGVLGLVPVVGPRPPAEQRSRAGRRWAPCWPPVGRSRRPPTRAAGSAWASPTRVTRHQRDHPPATAGTAGSP